MHGSFPSSKWQSWVPRIEFARMKNDHRWQTLPDSPNQPCLNQPQRTEPKKSATGERNPETSETKNAHRNTKQISLPEWSDRGAAVSKKRGFHRKKTGVVMHVLKCEFFREPRRPNWINRPARSAKSTGHTTRQIAKHSKASF